MWYSELSGCKSLWGTLFYSKLKNVYTSRTRSNKTQILHVKGVSKTYYDYRSENRMKISSGRHHLRKRKTQKSRSLKISKTLFYFKRTLQVVEWTLFRIADKKEFEKNQNDLKRSYWPAPTAPPARRQLTRVTYTQIFYSDIYLYTYTRVEGANLCFTQNVFSLRVIIFFFRTGGTDIFLVSQCGNKKLFTPERCRSFCAIGNVLQLYARPKQRV